MPAVSKILPQRDTTSIIHYNLIGPTMVTERSYFVLLHMSRCLRGSEVLLSMTVTGFSVCQGHAALGRTALPILPFANSQALVIHQDPVSMRGEK